LTYSRNKKSEIPEDTDLKLDIFDEVGEENPHAKIKRNRSGAIRSVNGRIVDAQNFFFFPICLSTRRPHLKFHFRRTLRILPSFTYFQRVREIKKKQ
jgi:hypothetical protein